MFPVMPPVTRSVLCSEFCPVVPGETLIADSYRLGTVALEGMPPGGGVAISGDGVSYLLTLPGTWSLGESVVCHEQNSAS
jgi:hypothetical protein